MLRVFNLVYVFLRSDGVSIALKNAGYYLKPKDINRGAPTQGHRNGLVQGNEAGGFSECKYFFAEVCFSKGRELGKNPMAQQQRICFSNCREPPESHGNTVAITFFFGGLFVGFFFPFGLFVFCFLIFFSFPEAFIA